ncbi:glutathione peroxidase [Methylocella sp.]|uniref:glutathione peroxidase n=1 Tax=Methylocella sp. TaxID=1978226 RepID=UPI003784DBC2
MTGEFYEFSARPLRGGAAAPFSRYEGQAALVVNTASKCGFTPQYAGLEALHETFGPAGLAVLAFPCDQFGGQEPGDAEAIANGCLVNYGVSFAVFEKVEVNGPRAHPLFVWLTDALPGLFGRAVRWNFTKFLISREGRPLRRFAPFTAPEKLEGPIRAALDG